MKNTCAPVDPKPATPQQPYYVMSSKTRLNELISWRLMKKNPAGALIWAILGAALAMDGFFFLHFLKHKEYQVDHKKRMWNERFEMLENPVKMKLFYPSDESVPKPCQPLIDVYTKMKEEEERRRKQLEECIKLSNLKK